MNSPPEVSRTTALIAFSALGLMALGFFVPFIGSIVIPYATTGEAPADWTWPKVGIAIFGMSAAIFYLGFVIYQQFATRMTDTEICMPDLYGTRCLCWEQIERIGSRGYVVILEGASETVRINTLCFKEPEEVVEYIYDHLPSRFKDASGPKLPDSCES